MNASPLCPLIEITALFVISNLIHCETISSQRKVSVDRVNQNMKLLQSSYLLVIVIATSNSGDFFSGEELNGQI